MVFLDSQGGEGGGPIILWKGVNKQKKYSHFNGEGINKKLTHQNLSKRLWGSWVTVRDKKCANQTLGLNQCSLQDIKVIPHLLSAKNTFWTCHLSTKYMERPCEKKKSHPTFMCPPGEVGEQGPGVSSSIGCWAGRCHQTHKSRSLPQRDMKGWAETRDVVVEQTPVSCPEHLPHDGRAL